MNEHGEAVFLRLGDSVGGASYKGRRAL